MLRQVLLTAVKLTKSCISRHPVESAFFMVSLAHRPSRHASLLTWVASLNTWREAARGQCEFLAGKS